MPPAPAVAVAVGPRAAPHHTNSRPRRAATGSGRGHAGSMAPKLRAPPVGTLESRTAAPAPTPPSQGWIPLAVPRRPGDGDGARGGHCLSPHWGAHGAAFARGAEIRVEEEVIGRGAQGMGRGRRAPGIRALALVLLAVAAAAGVAAGDPDPDELVRA